MNSMNFMRAYIFNHKGISSSLINVFLKIKNALIYLIKWLDKLGYVTNLNNC